MNKIIFTALAITISFLIIQSGFSQNAISINDAVRIAIDNNQQIKTANLNIAKEDAIKVKSFNIPQPKLFAEYEGVKGSLNNSESRKIGIIQELEFPVNYFLRSDVQSSQVLIAKEELNDHINHLRAEVKLNYCNLLLKYELLETAKDIFKIYDDFLVVAQKKYDAGETSNLEVLGAKVNKIKFENQVNNLESEIRSVNSELRNLMNINYDIIPADDVTFSEQQVSKTELLTRAINNSPELKIIKYRKEKFSNQITLSKWELMPDISISYFRQKLGSDNGYWGMEIGLGIPFWFWGEQSGNIKGYNYDLQIASGEEISLRRSLENDLNKSFEDHENSLRQLKFFRDEAIKEAEEIFRQAKISYSEGAIGYVEYLQSLAIVYDVRTEYLNSIFNYNRSLINLEEITAGEIK